MMASPASRVAAVVAALIFYLHIAHAAQAPMGMSMRGDLAEGPDDCLAIAFLPAPCAQLPSASVGAPLAAPLPVIQPIAFVPPIAVAARARASPAWLQRFLD